MSRWTHVRGGLELDSTPFESEKGENGKNTLYLPFPKEQMEVRFGGLSRRYDRGKELPRGLTFSATVYSLPRAKKYLDEAFSMLPQGEIGFHYSLKQDECDYNSSHSFLVNTSVEEAFYGAVEEFMARGVHGPVYQSCDIDTLINRYGLDVDFVDYANAMVLGVREDLRGCSGWEFAEALEKALHYLRENNIYVKDGYLEWQDEYELDWIYAWRSSRLQWSEEYSFMILDAKTNAILWKKTFSLPLDADGVVDYEATELATTVEGKLPWK